MPRFAFGSLAVFALLSGGTALGQTTYTWNNSGTDWATAGSWTNAGPPLAADTALFSANGSAAGSTLSNPNIVGGQSALSLTIAPNQNGGGWTFGGTGSLTLGGANSTGITTYGPQTTTFNGPTLSGTSTTNTIAVNVGSGSTLVLAGESAVTGNQGAVNLSGGRLTLDNSSGNASASAGRLLDALTNPVSFGGGTLSLIGNSAGTTETLGGFTMNAGSSTVSVTNNGGTGAVLAFTDSGSLRDSTAGTVNFVGLGTGTLGSSGNAPRITFSGALNANTVNGALTSSTSSATSVTYGWARVNGTGWAGNGSNGIVALAETVRDSATLASAAANEITTFAPSTATTNLSANLGAAGTALLLKITPTAAGQSLAASGNSINASAVMLAGPNDFSITGTGAMFGSVSSTRYIYVTDGNAVLNTSLTFAGTNQPFVKSGAGTVNMNGTTTQLGFTSNQNVNIVEGTLRGTLTTLGGGTSAGGAFTSLNLYGGVLEISGGGTFSRALNQAGAAAGGGLRWDASATARGDGGFSAIGGTATVTLVTTNGGSTAADLVWSSGGFVANGYALVMGSTKADSSVVLSNNIALDSGSGSSYFLREIRVLDNTNSNSDIARLTGVVSGISSTDLIKTGSGVLELGATNIYQGNTFVAGGELRVTGSLVGSNGNAGNVVVGSGGMLSGLGIITQGNGKATTILAGGTIRGGTSVTGETTGTLTLNNTSLIGGSGTSGATLATQLTTDGSGNVTGNSKLAVSTTTFNLDVTGGKVNIALLNDAGLVSGGSYSLELVTGSGGTNNFLRNGNVASGGNAYTAADVNLISGSGSWTFDAVSLSVNGSNNLVLAFQVAPVPEPATVLAIGAAGLGVMTWLRRRRKPSVAQ